MPPGAGAGAPWGDVPLPTLSLHQYGDEHRGQTCAMCAGSPLALHE